MSRVSIYETRWINLVFENKNKEYGAYQLRRESVKYSLLALFMGLFFIASIAGISTIIHYFNPKIEPEISIPDFTNTIIHVTDLVIPEIKKTVLPEIRIKSVETPIVTKQLINPIIAHPDESIPEVATNIEIKNASSTISDGKGIVGINPTAGTETGTEITKAVDNGNTIINTVALDKLPQFPGGMDKFYNYVGNNFEKPEIDGLSTIRVIVSFVIEKDGSMTDIQVKKDPGYGLGKEAIRVLKSLKTKWTPGMIGSKAVRTAYNLPITVQMD